jgi:hypothetical protein
VVIAAIADGVGGATPSSCDHDQRGQGCAALEGGDLDDGARPGRMMPGGLCQRFQSRMGTMAKIFPFASVNRKLSGSRPEWRLITSGARVFAAAIASSLVSKTQISFSTGMAPKAPTLSLRRGRP